MEPFRYSGGCLDRAGVNRRDEGWVAGMMADPAARVVPVWRDRNLVAPAEGGMALVASRCEVAQLRQPAIPPLVETTVTWVFLGVEEGRVPIFAADLSAVAEERAVELLGGGGGGGGGGGTFQDLRRVGPRLTDADAALMAYARGMLTWHRRNLHCGVCGGATVSTRAGHVRQCTNPACGEQTFPRTDPAVIMLVERPASGSDPARCLLARHARLPRAVYSTLAGFVEPGESLEEAVAREVLEETGVSVASVRYHGSQPWPFPASLMVGFRAVASTSAIAIDPEELDEARWFSAADLDAFGEWGDEGAARCLPRPDSIARSLVESWRADQRAGARGS